MIAITLAGAISGTNGGDGNAVFTLSSGAAFVDIFMNGLLLTPGTAYTLAGTTVTFLAPYIPVVGSYIVGRGEASGAGSGGGGGGGGAGPIYVSDLVYRGYRIAGIIPVQGRTYSATEGDEGRKVLNSMLDSWRIERLIVWAELRTEFDLTLDQQTYLIGTGAPDFDIERPRQIERAGYIFTNLTPEHEIPFQIFNSPTSQQWAALSPKLIEGTIPYVLWYQPTVPNGTITLWPVPTTAGKIALYTWQTVTQFAALTDPVVVPDGYQAALEYNLAVELAVQFPDRQKMSPIAIAMAAQKKTAIKIINYSPLLMRVERAFLGRSGSKPSGRFDIFSNTYR